MKVTIPCQHCLRESGQDSTQAKLYTIQVSDDGTYDLTCDHGHQTTLFGQSAKYELLLEIALNALVDGYFREAVASAASSLERFYEFSHRCMLHSRGVPHSVIDEAWNRVKAQSERQLGLFIAAHVSCFQEMPALLPEADVGKPSVAFRNAVIHKGKIPSSEDAIAFVTAVHSIMVRTIGRMKGDIFGSVMEITLQEIQKVGGNKGSGGAICAVGDDLTLSIMRLLCDPCDLATPEFGSAAMLSRSVEDRLEEIRYHRAKIVGLNGERARVVGWKAAIEFRRELG